MNSLFAFFLGQLSIVLLIFAFINFFIFGDPPSPNYASSKDRRTRSSSSTSSSRPYLSSSSFLIPRRRRQSAVLRPQPVLSTKTILKKTYYNVNGHQPESLDWFNVLIAQTIAQLRAEAQHDGAILGTLNTLLNGKWKPDFLGDIVVTEINLGEEFPIFSNCRIIPVHEDGMGAKVGGDARHDPSQTMEGARLQARLDMDLNDVITLGIETKLLLNYPKPRVAVLPVALAVSVVRFRGTLSLSFVPSPYPLSTLASNTSPSATSQPDNAYASNPSPSPMPQPSPTTLEFSFLPDYDIELSVRSLVGSRSRLQDLPKIAQLVEARLRTWFDERCVEPRVQQIVLPNFWPRKRNTRGPEAGASEDGDEEAVDTEVEREVSSPKRKAKMRQETVGSVDRDGNAAENNSNGHVSKDERNLEARLAEDGRKLREAEGSRRKPFRQQDPP